MIQKTQWRPDTCKCVLEYTWDDTVPGDKRVHTPVAPVEQCDAHKHDDPQAHFDAVVAENSGKNKAVAAIKENLDPAYADAEVAWSFDEKRALTVSVDVPDEQKAELQKAVEDATIT